MDNRDELINLLNIDKAIITDTDLILASYERWGLGCPAKIVGDFAFAIWDQREKRLLLARDLMGMRVLYYRQDSNKLLFGTELK